jgi:hypothetical protein
MIVTTVRPDGELYRPWNSRQLQSVLDLESDLEHVTDPVRGDAVQHVDVEHDVHRAGLDR